MFKTVTREITLAIQVRSGLSMAVVASMAVIAAALLIAFGFLCVSGYACSRYSSVPCSQA